MMADRGYEFTDEGFYLNWLSNPGLWPTSTTLFGFVYHPLFIVLDGDIAQMRRVSVVLTLCLSWVAAFLALGPARRSWPRVIGVSIATAVASVALRLHNLWLLTPNYNILVLQSALLIVVGLLLWWESDHAGTNAHDVPRRSLLMQWGAATMVGIGGVALFLAKPPGAAATGLIVALAITLACRSRRMVLLSAAIAATSLSALTIIFDGSPAGTVARFRAGADELRALDAGHSLLDALLVDSLNLSLSTAAVGLGSLSAVTGLTWALTKVPGRRERSLFVLGGAVALVLTAGLIVLHPIVVAMRVPGAVLVPLSVPVCAIGCRVTWELRSRTSHSQRRPDLVLAGCLLLMPITCTLGTNTNTWIAAGQCAVIWTISALVVLRPLFETEGWQLLTPTAVAATALAVVPIIIAMDQPYHQPGPVWAYDESVRIGADATLKVSDPVADTIRGMEQVAQDAEMPPGAVVIDLSGRAPGLVYALGAQPLNSPWVPRAFPGSEDALRMSIDRLTCHQVRAVWLLDQPGSPHDLAAAYFPAVGASASDFEVMGEVPLPPTSNESTIVEPPLRLLRDRRDAAAAEQACRSAREAR